jgi:hypothetical protein
MDGSMKKTVTDSTGRTWFSLSKVNKNLHKPRNASGWPDVKSGTTNIKFKEKTKKMSLDSWDLMETEVPKLNKGLSIGLDALNAPRQSRKWTAWPGHANPFAKQREYYGCKLRIPMAICRLAE